MTKSDKSFLIWLRDTLIPDLKDSGSKYTAEDMQRAVKIATRLDSSTTGLTKSEDRFVEFLLETLIPDLKESGRTAMAEDFETMVDMIDRLHRRAMR